MPLRGGEEVLVGLQDQPPTAIMSDTERHDDENPTTSAAGELDAPSAITVILSPVDRGCLGF